MAVENDVKTIAFLSISTDAYHFPPERAVEIAVRKVKKILDKNDKLGKVIFVGFDDESCNTYREILNGKQKTDR